MWSLHLFPDPFISFLFCVFPLQPHWPLSSSWTLQTHSTSPAPGSLLSGTLCSYIGPNLILFPSLKFLLTVHSLKKTLLSLTTGFKNYASTHHPHSFHPPCPCLLFSPLWLITQLPLFLIWNVGFTPDVSCEAVFTISLHTRSALDDLCGSLMLSLALSAPPEAENNLENTVKYCTKSCGLHDWAINTSLFGFHRLRH